MVADSGEEFDHVLDAVRELPWNFLMIMGLLRFPSLLQCLAHLPASLWFAFRQRGVVDTFIGAIVLGLAIAAMHYSGMEASRFLPVSGPMEALRLVLSEHTVPVRLSRAEPKTPNWRA
jgi:hypothetical protein